MSDRPTVKTQQVPPPSPALPAKRPMSKLPVTGPQRYEYKLVGYIAQMAETTFNIYGEQGWRYIGAEPTGKAVFIREQL